MARLHEFVLPSGIRCIVRNFIGEDYDTLTDPRYTKNNTQFNKLAKSVVQQIGDETNITEEMITNLFSNDRKMILLEARQHTMHHEDVFRFNYEWPLQGGKKSMQSYEVEFTEDQFPIIPFKWVREAMEAKDAESENLNGAVPRRDSLRDEEFHRNGDRYDKNYFPELFTSYADLIEEHGTQQFILPTENQELQWHILNGRAEKQYSRTPAEKRTINLFLAMRTPQLLLQPTGDNGHGNEPVKTGFNYKQADAYDLEELRYAIRDTEGTVNTFLVIEKQDDPSTTVRVDLLTTESFFFPSQAR